ncbi:hypothetical protein SteCoe_34418 [Stentor coeruleus]|uniref:Uncharacterized protein n=1 Tax=Stentor coeruleus TaxID=5963 RepID=A0A1R2AUK6_9CILI|nr:hypothetical protein SteCoe_34418 [Stentor coeruleus]
MRASILIAVLGLYAIGVSGELGTGQSCSSSSTFVVTDFTVDPYPPTSGVQMSVNMYGTFSKEMYVSDISIRTRFNGGSWSYKYIDIGQTFNYGQIYTFSFPLTAGTTKGLYENQVGLETKQGSSFSCWDFTYHIY